VPHDKLFRRKIVQNIENNFARWKYQSDVSRVRIYGRWSTADRPLWTSTEADLPWINIRKSTHLWRAVSEADLFRQPSWWCVNAGWIPAGQFRRIPTINRCSCVEERYRMTDDEEVFVGQVSSRSADVGCYEWTSRVIVLQRRTAPWPFMTIRIRYRECSGDTWYTYISVGGAHSFWKTAHEQPCIWEKFRLFWEQN